MKINTGWVLAATIAGYFLYRHLQNAKNLQVTTPLTATPIFTTTPLKIAPSIAGNEHPFGISNY